jgi:hypothetical protein
MARKELYSAKKTSCVMLQWDCYEIRCQDTTNKEWES